MFGDLGKKDRLAKLYFHINVTVCFLGINCCVFLRAQIKAFKAVSDSKRGKSPSLSVGHPGPGVATCFSCDLRQVTRQDQKCPKV